MKIVLIDTKRGGMARLAAAVNNSKAGKVGTSGVSKQMAMPQADPRTKTSRTPYMSTHRPADVARTSIPTLWDTANAASLQPLASIFTAYSVVMTLE
ncbi:oxidoreductase [Cystobacter fuscus DSM 2262]|uniref:Oxidoreductase n=1 Tax=Cystobacter fuscus (strain ATCC 25194 / DSM 2262 / NBRC 100088 / M29) TaxID=1242864 RepID=S9R369_CYSF2|nr:oxidoreductase [Cystobacter fuscus DSM 2262]